MSAQECSEALERVKDLKAEALAPESSSSSRRTFYKELIALPSYASYECKAFFGENIGEFFGEFVDLQDGVIDALLDLCEDDDEQIRIIGIKGLGPTGQADPKWVRGNTGVLLQLLACQPLELKYVRESLFALLTVSPAEVFAVMADDCKGSEGETGASRRNILDFLYYDAITIRRDVLESGTNIHAEDAFRNGFMDVLPHVGSEDKKEILEMILPLSTISGKNANEKGKISFCKIITNTISRHTSLDSVILIIKVFVEFIERARLYDPRYPLLFFATHGAAIVQLAMTREDGSVNRILEKLENFIEGSIAKWRHEADREREVTAQNLTPLFISSTLPALLNSTDRLKGSAEKLARSAIPIERILYAVYRLATWRDNRPQLLSHKDSDAIMYLFDDADRASQSLHRGSTEARSLKNIADMAQVLGDHSLSHKKVVPTWRAPKFKPPGLGLGQGYSQSPSHPPTSSYQSREHQPSYQSREHQSSYNSREHQPSYQSREYQSSYQSREHKPSYQSRETQPSYQSREQQPLYHSREREHQSSYQSREHQPQSYQSSSRYPQSGQTAAAPRGPRQDSTARIPTGPASNKVPTGPRADTTSSDRYARPSTPQSRARSRSRSRSPAREYRRPITPPLPSHSPERKPTRQSEDSYAQDWRNDEPQSEVRGSTPPSLSARAVRAEPAAERYQPESASTKVLEAETMNRVPSLAERMSKTSPDSGSGNKRPREDIALNQDGNGAIEDEKKPTLLARMSERDYSGSTGADDYDGPSEAKRLRDSTSSSGEGGRNKLSLRERMHASLPSRSQDVTQRQGQGYEYAAGGGGGGGGGLSIAGRGNYNDSRQGQSGGEREMSIRRSSSSTFANASNNPNLEQESRRRNREQEEREYEEVVRKGRGFRAPSPISISGTGTSTADYQQQQQQQQQYNGNDNGNGGQGQGQGFGIRGGASGRGRLMRPHHRGRM